MQLTSLRKTLKTAQNQGHSWLEADDESEDNRTGACLTHTEMYILVLTLGQCDIQVKCNFNGTKGFGNSFIDPKSLEWSQAQSRNLRNLY